MMESYLQRPIAHRGLHCELIPENSLESFLRAQERGFSIELDVRLSKDGVPIVFHDKDLSRMTGAKGRVDQYTLKSLKSLRLCNTKHDIPTLQEVLDAINEDTTLIIEIKSETMDFELEKKMSEVLKNSSAQFCIQSFNVFSLKWFRRNFRYIPLGLLTTDKFDGARINFFKKQVVRYMPFAPLVRPDYVGFNHESFSATQLNFISQSTNAHILFWTIRSKADYEKIRRVADNIIFEGFDPYE